MTARETDATLAWHFVGATLRDGRPIPADGEWLRYNGRIELCESGLHASLRVIDALRYAPGTTVCRVALRGIAESEADKVVARERVILWRVDTEDVLRAFARRCALSVIHLWDAPEVVRRYLETGDEALRKEAAREAAAAWAAWAAGAAGARAAWARAARAARAAGAQAAQAAAWAAAWAAWAAWAAAAAWAARAAEAWAAVTNAEQDEWLEAMIREAAGNPDDAMLMERLA